MILVQIITMIITFWSTTKDSLQNNKVNNSNDRITYLSHVNSFFKNSMSFSTQFTSRHQEMHVLFNYTSKSTVSIMVMWGSCSEKIPISSCKTALHKIKACETTYTMKTSWRLCTDWTKFHSDKFWTDLNSANKADSSSQKVPWNACTYTQSL